MKIKLARIFPSRIAKLGDGGHAQRVQGLVILFAGEGWVEHQRAGEKEGDPEQAGAVAAGFGGGGVEGEAEEDYYDQGEDYCSGEEFARAEFEAKFFGKNDCGGSHGSQKQIPLCGPRAPKCGAEAKVRDCVREDSALFSALKILGLCPQGCQQRARVAV